MKKYYTLSKMVDGHEFFLSDINLATRKVSFSEFLNKGMLEPDLDMTKNLQRSFLDLYKIETEIVEIEMEEEQ